MLTAAEVRGQPHLSVSQLSSWLMCPRKYRFQYLDRLPWSSVPSALVFGTAVHAALGAFHEAAMEGRHLGLAELHEVFLDSWAAEQKPIEFKSGETAEGLSKMAQQMLMAFLGQVKPAEVLGVEEPFRFHLADGLPPLIGFIDLIERRGDRVVIVEYKTGAARFSEQRVRDDLQISAYALAGLEMDLPGVDTVEDLGLEFCVLLKLKTPVIDRRPTLRSVLQLEELRDTATSIHRAIQAGAFPRNRSWACATCPFRSNCKPH